jgi:hypothetical protein
MLLKCLLAGSGLGGLTREYLRAFSDMFYQQGRGGPRPISLPLKTSGGLHRVLTPHPRPRPAEPTD